VEYWLGCEMTDNITPTTEDKLKTHEKLSVIVSKRLIDFINSRDAALEALQPKDKKKEPDIELAIALLNKTKPANSRK